MTLHLFAQFIGVIAFLIGVTTFFHRRETYFKLQLASCTGMMSLHFFLMDANAAAASALLNALRTVVSIRIRHSIVMLIFICLTLILGVPNIKNPIEALPIIGTLLGTWAFFKTTGLATRCLLWCATLCWLTHNIWLGSVGGTLTEGCFLLMNGIAIIRFYRMKLNGIDPFAP